MKLERCKLWDRESEGRNIAKIKRENVCKQREEDETGITNLKLFNIVLS